MTEQEHLLVCLMEECGEVIQACGKALRFGLDDNHQAANPDIVSPRLYLRKELNDLAAVADLYQADWMDETLMDAKKTKLAGFMEYARSRGTLDESQLESSLTESMKAEIAAIRERQRKRAESADLWTVGLTQSHKDIDFLLSALDAVSPAPLVPHDHRSEFANCPACQMLGRIEEDTSILPPPLVDNEGLARQAAVEHYAHAQKMVTAIYRREDCEAAQEKLNASIDELAAIILSTCFPAPLIPLPDKPEEQEGFGCDRCGEWVDRPRKEEIDTCTPCKKVLTRGPVCTDQPEQQEQNQESGNEDKSSQPATVVITEDIQSSDAWEPITTAPKDGTRILVYFGDLVGVREVHWNCLWSDDLETNGGWHVDDLKHGPYPLRKYCDGDDECWQPLPAPPQKEEG